MSFEKNYEIHSDCLESTRPVEYFSIEKQKKRLILAADGDDLISQTRSSLEIAAEWLPLAAEKYNISADLKDYILVPTVILSNSLPNRNGIGFPLETLCEWNPEAAQVAYKTFVGRPTHVNHVNKDYSIAKGVVFDAVMRPMHNVLGNLFKVVTLCGFDRTRDPVLCNTILNSKTTALSLGCWASGYSCSVCGHVYKQNEECSHVKLNAMPRTKIFSENGGVGKVAFYKAHGIQAIEVSSVTVPAFYSAQVDKEHYLNVR